MAVAAGATSRPVQRMLGQVSAARCLTSTPGLFGDDLDSVALCSMRMCHKCLYRRDYGGSERAKGRA